MEKEFELSTIFKSIYSRNKSFNGNNIFIKNSNPQLLEQTLKEYIIKVMGYRSDYRDYYSQISKYFENIINNCEMFSNFNNIIDSIKRYGDEYINNIQSRYYSSIFFDSMKSIYSDDYTATFISNKGNSYVIGKSSKINEESMPYIVINDIDELEDTLCELVSTYKNSNHDYGILLNSSDQEYGISEFFKWIVKNANVYDLNDINKYLRKYISYINDDTFNDYKKPTYLGEFYNDEVYMKLSSCDAAFETPYYFIFMLKNSRISMPCVRFGIDNNKEKTANILAIQSSKGDKTNEQEFNDYIKRNLPKSKHFRIYNPSHLVSLVLTIGLLKSHGIDKITVADYLPFRYQRFIQEKNMSEEELNDYQSRLTDKNINSYMRLMEFCDGLDIESYPEFDMPFTLSIRDDIHFDNEFLQNIYEIGCSLKENNRQIK